MSEIPESRRIKRLQYTRKWAYGITNETFEQMLLEQGNRCAICRREFEEYKLTTKFGSPAMRPHVDHDHKTGRIRGLLCRRCNSLLGALDDSVTILERVKTYLSTT